MFKINKWISNRSLIDAEIHLVEKHWSMFNYVEFELPIDCINDLFTASANDIEVWFWQNKLNLGLQRDNMISELLEYGAWDNDELMSLDDDELEQKLIWIAAHDIKDNIVIVDW